MKPAETPVGEAADCRTDEIAACVLRKSAASRAAIPWSWLFSCRRGATNELYGSNAPTSRRKYSNWDGRGLPPGGTYRGTCATALPASASHAATAAADDKHNHFALDITKLPSTLHAAAILEQAAAANQVYLNGLSVRYGLGNICCLRYSDKIKVRSLNWVFCEIEEAFSWFAA
jgi:hypothetical protein